MFLLTAGVSGGIVTLIADIHVGAENFALGRLTGSDPRLVLELERPVPTGTSLIPYVWARGGDFAAFETRLDSSPEVDSFRRLDRVDGRVLYRVEWAVDAETLIGALARTDTTVLEARGGREWRFRLRFPGRAELADFRDRCREFDVPIRLSRVRDLDRTMMPVEVTPQQREALEVATRVGYFDVPRGATLSAVAPELGISEQAAGERIRRGVRRLVFTAVESDTT
jgi:predicted DNA binding protein